MKLPRLSAGKAGGRAGWTFIDQGINTATNFALIAFVAHGTSPDEFGAFSVVYAIVVFVVTVCQALIGETLLVTSADDPNSRRSSSMATGAAVAIGASLGVMFAAYAAIANPDRPELVLLLAGLLPGLLLQDSARVTAISRGHPKIAASSDLVWGVLQAASFVTLDVSGAVTPAWCFMTWGFSGLVAGLFACARLRAAPRPLHGARWLAGHRRLGGAYAIESLAFAGASQLTTVVVAAVSSLAAAGALRAGQSIYGPASIILMTLRLIGIAESRSATGDPRRLANRVMVFSVVGAAIGLLVLLSVVLVPDSVGTVFFGPTWFLAVPLLVPLGLQRVLTGTAVGPFVGLRVLRATHVSLPLRVFTAVVTCATGVLGAVLGGANGCAYGIFIGNALGVALMLAAVGRLLGAREAAPDPELAT